MDAKFIRVAAAVWSMIALTCANCVQAGTKAELLECRKIWDKAPHNAFTDLAYFKRKWICVFREGNGHVSPDGAVRVIESRDGKEWVSAALIKDELGDLRDPKVMIAPGNKLMVVAAIALPQPNSAKHWSVVSFSDDGDDWSKPLPAGEPNIWIWRAVWEKGNCYGLGYATDGKEFVRLYESKDGKQFVTLVPELLNNRNKEGEPNESGLVFLPDRSAVCLVRRDGQPGTGLLGTVRPPYRDWEWKDLGFKIGGPQIIRLPDGRLIAGARLYDGGARTSVLSVNATDGKAEEILKLPSGGDTSYPGLVWQDGVLWVSYYSSHEGKTAIYLAKVRLR